MSQTRQFMLRMGTYGPDQLEGGQLPEYRELVTEVITPKFATSFDQSVATAEQIVAQAGVSREAEVFSAGVSTIDADSATALVAGTFTDSYPDNAGELRPQEPVPFRIQVTLVKTEGEWLVDDFTPVTAVRAVSAPPGPGWYDVLDVEPTATTDEIREAWRAAIADLTPSDRRFRLYNQAAEVLLDDEQRAAYDAELAAAAPEARAGGRRSDRDRDRDRERDRGRGAASRRPARPHLADRDPRPVRRGRGRRHGLPVAAAVGGGGRERGRDRPCRGRAGRRCRCCPTTTSRWTPTSRRRTT